MKYKIAVKEMATGEVRLHDLGVEWGDSSLFWLTEGNFGCDCNRELTFRRAAGEAIDETAFEAAKCGEGRYAILYAELEDGSRVNIDGE